MTKVTLQTIADHLSVSRTTVSNAFNRPDQLTDELRDQILETARQLGYGGPHPAARTLRTGRSGALGVVLTESLSYAFDNPYSLEFLAGIAEKTETSQQGLYLIPSPPGAAQLRGVRHAVVDGFCVFSLPDSHPMVPSVVERGLPTVFVDGPLLEDHSFVGIHDREAMTEMATHLADLGHRDVAIVCFRLMADDRIGAVDRARLESVDYRVTRERLGGAISAWESVGVAPQIHEIGQNVRDGARSAAQYLLGLENPPTAIMCMSDQIGLGVLDAATDAGVEVPRRLSVTGFDGSREARSAGLVTIDQPGRAKGTTAVELLGGDTVEHVFLPYDLVPGLTTAPPTS